MKKKPASTPKPASEPLVAWPITRAIFAQDELLTRVLDEDRPRLPGKQIWLLEGSFTVPQLTMWVDAIKRGFSPAITATIIVMSLDAVKWPEMHYYFPRGSSMRILTHHEHFHFMLALNAICEGDVIRGHLLLMHGGIDTLRHPPSDRAADTDTMVVTEE